MKEKNQVFAQQFFNALLIVVVIGLLGFLSMRFKTDIDWTAGNRNTLTAASVKQLKAMPDPLTFYVFAPSGAETRHAIEADLERSKRVKKNRSAEHTSEPQSPIHITNALYSLTKK